MVVYRSPVDFCVLYPATLLLSLTCSRNFSIIYLSQFFGIVYNNHDICKHKKNLISSFSICWLRNCKCVLQALGTYVHTESLKSCPTLCNPMDCSPQGFSIHGLLQARTLERVAISSSSGCPQPRYQTHGRSPALAGGFFITSATWKLSFSLKNFLMTFCFSFQHFKYFTPLSFCFHSFLSRIWCNSYPCFLIRKVFLLWFLFLDVFQEFVFCFLWFK